MSAQCCVCPLLQVLLRDPVEWYPVRTDVLQAERRHSLLGRAFCVFVSVSFAVVCVCAPWDSAVSVSFAVVYVCVLFGTVQ